MKHFTRQDILQMEKIFRLNLINSCTGYKSANLLATKSKDGIENVAIFSSVIHLGSNPPLLGFILRPTTVPRNTFDNLKATQQFTVNHVGSDIMADAHHTSAKYEGTVSEFSKTNLRPHYRDSSYAPYVAAAKVQLGCRYANDYFIKENDCLLIIGQIEHLYLEPNLLEADGFISLEKAKTVTVNGLDGYALPTLLERFEYARPKP
ncbi:MAG: flavin oxidoreductase [Flavobacteriaceae bacterium]|nr:flavin oxidoreductase [Flavobacteriaceae bacterium]